jgi:hypothetical protein
MLDQAGDVDVEVGMKRGVLATINETVYHLEMVFVQSGEVIFNRIARQCLADQSDQLIRHATHC